MSLKENVITFINTVAKDIKDLNTLANQIQDRLTNTSDKTIKDFYFQFNEKLNSFNNDFETRKEKYKKLKQELQDGINKEYVNIKNTFSKDSYVGVIIPGSNITDLLESDGSISYVLFYNLKPYSVYNISNKVCYRMKDGLYKFDGNMIPFSNESETKYFLVDDKNTKYTLKTILDELISLGLMKETIKVIDTEAKRQLFVGDQLACECILDESGNPTSQEIYFGGLKYIKDTYPGQVVEYIREFGNYNHINQ